MTEDNEALLHLVDHSPALEQTLRKRAEKQAGEDMARIKHLPPSEEMLQTLHELQIHQIELKLQNEELKRVQVELQASEARYFDLYDLAPVGYFTLSEKGMILDANLTAVKLLRVSRSDLTRQPLAHFILPENQDIFYLNRNKLFETGLPQVFEMRMLRKGAASFWARVEATIVHDDDCTPVCRAVVSDITDRKRLEEKLDQAKKFESISTFSAGIAHDFNNFLAIILSYITLSADDIKKPEEALLLLEEATKTIFKVKDLTHNFLLLSGAGIEYNNTAEPYKVIKETIFAEQASNVKFEFALPEEEREVNCAPNLLSQIVASILKNSIEAMPAGGVLKIKAEHIDYKEEENRLPLKDGKYFFICISDNGCGISQENLPRIFDPYFSTKQMGAQKGMGLSLSVVYLIIIRLNGYIQIESKKGAGTEVFIYLPATGKPAARNENMVEAWLPEINAEARAAAGTKRILFMDDEEPLRTTAKIMLEKAGYTVDVARSGEEALQKYVLALNSGIPFDVVILDLSIVGGMGGVETIKILLKINPEVKAIVSSGYSNDQVIFNYKTYGFKGALTKPATREQMVEALKKLC